MIGGEPYTLGLFDTAGNNINIINKRTTIIREYLKVTCLLTAPDNCLKD